MHCGVKDSILSDDVSNGELLTMLKFLQNGGSTRSEGTRILFCLFNTIGTYSNALTIYT